MNINTQPLLNELNNIINKTIEQKFNDLLERNKILEETHNIIVNLPSVKQCYVSKNNSESKTECSKVCNIIEEDYVTKRDNSIFLSSIEEKMQNIFKMNSELFDRLTNEISELKHDIKLLKENKKPDDENIKLELEEISNEIPEIVHVSKDEEVEEDEEDDMETEIKSVETETKEDDEDDEEEEEELIEIEIDDVTYCTNDENNGIIYELDNEGNVGKKVGYLKDGDVYFE